MIIPMQNKPKLIAFSSQKGGVGKSGFTVLTASILHYTKNKNVLVVDADYPQFSIQKMRAREIEMINKNDTFKKMMISQFRQLNKKAYEIISSSPDDVMETISEHLESYENKIDYVLIDLPGTVNSSGVLKTISKLDFLFLPVTADKIVLESSLSFASVVQQNLDVKGIYLFWNMVDRREKTALYDFYNRIMDEMQLKRLIQTIPDTKKYRKELSDECRGFFRSTFFPPERKLLYGSQIDYLVEEIFEIIK